MENEANTQNNQNIEESALNRSQNPIVSTSNAEIVQQASSFINKIPKQPILIGGIIVVVFFVLVLIINKIFPTQVGTICYFNLLGQCGPGGGGNSSCMMKHLISLGLGGTFGGLAIFGIPLLIPGGLVIAPATLLLLGVGFFAGSSVLMELLLPC